MFAKTKQKGYISNLVCKKKYTMDTAKPCIAGANLQMALKFIK